MKNFKFVVFSLFLLSIFVLPAVVKADCNPGDAPSITVISPNGGEVYNAGDEINVTWTSCNIVGNILEINLDDSQGWGGGEGLTFNKQISNNGTYTATLPTSSEITAADASFGKYFTIEIAGEDYNGNIIKDSSDNTFTIKLSNDTRINSVTYIVSTLGGGAETITNVPFGTSKATFLSHIVRAYGSTWDNSNINDPVESGDTLTGTAQDGVTQITYTITVNDPTPSITVTSPNGGETFTVGDVMNITWDSSEDEQNVDISFQYHEGADEVSIEYPIVNNIHNTGAYSFTIPSIIQTSCESGLCPIPFGNFYKVAVFDDLSPRNFDDSNNYFTINDLTVNPSATTPIYVGLRPGSINSVGGMRNVVMPGKDGTDASGEVNNWIANTADTIKFVVEDSGSAISTITINDSPYTSGDDYQIINTDPITIVVTTTESDKLDTVRTFKVNVKEYISPSITVTYPNGGETFTAGDQVTVKWTSVGILEDATVSVFLENTNDDVTHSTSLREGGTLNDGEETFSLGSFIGSESSQEDWPVGKHYKIKINSYPIKDSSDSTFTINASTPVPTPSIELLPSFESPASVDAGNKNVDLAKFHFQYDGSDMIRIDNVTLGIHYNDDNNYVNNHVFEKIYLKAGETMRSFELTNQKETLSMPISFFANPGLLYNHEFIIAGDIFYPAKDSLLSVGIIGFTYTNMTTGQQFSTPLMDEVLAQSSYIKIKALAQELIPSITVISPNSGFEAVESGQKVEIRWDSNVSINALVDVWVSDGIHKGEVVRTNNNGPLGLIYTLDSSLAPGSNYKAYVSLVAENPVEDSSDNPFTIKAPVVITKPSGGGGSGGSYLDFCPNIPGVQKKSELVNYVLLNGKCLTKEEYKIAITPVVTNIIPKKEPVKVITVKPQNKLAVVKSKNNKTKIAKIPTTKKVAKTNLPVKKVVAQKITIPTNTLTASAINALNTTSITTTNTKNTTSFWKKIKNIFHK